MNKEEIIKEFREKFVEKGGTENMWLWSLKGFHPNMVEDFWLSKLRAQNQDLLKKIEGMKMWPFKDMEKMEKPVRNYDEEKAYGYNQALEDIKNLIK